MGAAAGAAVWAARPAAGAPGDATSFLAHFKGLKLLDQDGQPVLPAQLAQHMVLINFVFTGCSTVCPVQTRSLVQLRQQLPPALQARMRQLSISLDPLSDTPQALKAYARGAGADLPGWRFATGRPADIERLSEVLSLFRPGSGARKLEDHNTALWLVDAQGQLRQRYSGNPVDVARLASEISALDALSRRPQS